MTSLTRTPLKLLLATLLAVGLMPLAEAHECQPRVYSVDPSHRIPVLCNLLVCVYVPHACMGSIQDVRLADPAATAAPLLP